MCNCYQKMESLLLDACVKKFTGAEDHKVDLVSYGLTLDKQLSCSVRPSIAYEASALLTAKSGAQRRKRIKGSLVASYCPFCGEKYATGQSGEEG